ncbi:hypothetical protein HU200_013521 [Digitaria exilis]|uniref:Proton pump-interactor 1 n=1 Tax=Digitaria exilis TaxID=1010633 RepID=A0A835FD98_9POAL|nr:hypothetical protein HU200_013521 [Digitaria exilis]
MEPQNQAKEWPESTCGLYFVKICSFEDPELEEKLVEADNEFQKKIQARNKIIEVARAKKVLFLQILVEHSIISSELKQLIAENNQYHGVVETLQNHLGRMFRDRDNILQAHGSVLYSAIEELEQRIKMLSDRVVSESITIREEKLLVKDIKDIEKAKSKVIYLSTNRVKLQDTMDGNEATQDKDKVIDAIRKDQQTIRSKIKVLKDELTIVDTEVASIQEDLDAAIARKDRAYESLAELRHARDAKGNGDRTARAPQDRGVLLEILIHDLMIWIGFAILLVILSQYVSGPAAVEAAINSRDMGMEVVGAETAPAEVKVSDGEVNLFQEKESKATAKEREEAAVFGSETTMNAADMAPPKDAKDDWPEPKQTYVFYFVKIRSFEDPKLRAKLELADKEFQKKIQARSKLIEALRAKKAVRSGIISELKPLSAENKQYNEVVNEKIKEMEPLRNSLGKFREENNALRAQGAGLCSSIEELDQTIKMLNDRIVHESISLNEEKRLVKEIKDLEKTRSKVLSNTANRAKLQDTVVEKEAIQDQVKIIGEGIDGIKKERQAVRSKIKVLEDELKAVDAEIASLQEDLDGATARKDKAYESLQELRAARDAKVSLTFLPYSHAEILSNASFLQNRTVLNKARDYSSRNMLTELQELHKTEVDKFMTQWCESKTFREDYEKRILVSLNSRQLTRDGRMRNPDEKPIFIESQAPVPAVEPEPIPVKLPAKQAKEASAPQADEAPKVEARSKGPVKSLKAKAALDADDDYEAEPPKEKAKPTEADVAKLKEIKRQEEIEKNRLALERKKKQAEKQAAKAAARAQDAEKKQKKEEKKAKKKSGAADTDEPSESNAKSDEATETQAEEEAAPTSATLKKEQKESVRPRNVVSRSKAPPPRAILKRKKAQSYWSWAGPAAAVAAVLVALLAVLAYYQYYLPASTSN